ncbi:hypothetical protein JCGZ_03399 [Jatropha curcas]|uniref:Uncharacterized protein n=1 Tax=Jatropha curcas TaxID=180498 RepID=A0A067KY15_JATCU|nr:hypothetical protein JCGZ_03399 [Jatropha curcas]
MGLPLVLIAKLKFLSVPSSSTHTVVSPFLNTLLCPYLVKLAYSLRLAHRAYSDLIYASRLFFFQLGRIAFDEDNNARDQTGAPVNDRWERALRLVCQRARRSPPVTQSDEDSFHALSMFSL